MKPVISAWEAQGNGCFRIHARCGDQPDGNGWWADIALAWDRNANDCTGGYHTTFLKSR